MEMDHATNELAAESQAGSVGRRLEDVQSEVGSLNDLPTTTRPTDGVYPTPPTAENPLAAVFSQPITTPTIYDVFSQNRGVHIIDELGVTDRPTNDVSAVSAKAGPSPLGVWSQRKLGPYPLGMWHQRKLCPRSQHRSLIITGSLYQRKLCTRPLGLWYQRKLCPPSWSILDKTPY